MDETNRKPTNPSRRGFIRSTGAGLAAAAAMSTAAVKTAALPLSEKEKLARIASNTYPVRSLFKTRSTGRGVSPQVEALRKKYGEITMLDFPQFTKDTFAGVRSMDLWSSLFGDVGDDTMFIKGEFDPSSASGQRWLDELAARIAKTGVRCQHVSNNAPRNICDPDAELRKQGIAVAKVWLDGCARIGAKTMRVNTGGPRIVPSASATQGYPRNDEIVKLLKNAIESFKEMAEYGGKAGVKVTIENHWGLSADPMNVRIILDEVKHPFCEASPDFCNWEHEYMLFHALEALAPYTHTTVHAKYWDRWSTNDVQRCVRILEKAGFKGIYALEYEAGPWDGIEGSRYLLKEVMAAL
jgi:sugar phosphate isomerase/epimerase